MKHFVRMLFHSGVMVRRNLRSYAMLSVTIVLSFSLLLGYLLYTDSKLYNKYAWVLSQDPKAITFSVNYPEDAAKLPVIMEQLEALGQTQTYVSTSAMGQISASRYTLSDGTAIELPPVMIYGVPAHIWTFYGKDGVVPAEIEWLDHREARDVSLQSGQMLMSRGLFHALGLENQKTPTFHLKLRSTSSVSGETFEKEMTVVGVFSANYTESGFATMPEDLTEEVLLGQTQNYLTPSVVIPMEDFDPARLNPEDHTSSALHIYTEHPELAVQILDQAQVKSGYWSVYLEHKSARERIQIEKRTKAVIAVGLLLLLGINLYSSFNNALNERKFEIGVKRAVGASAFSIVRQFLYESSFVMLINILLSIITVTDIGVLYKLLYESTPDAYGHYRLFVLQISGYSIGMFLICAFSLTIVFCLIFAYKTTQVEIVKYLKAE